MKILRACIRFIQYVLEIVILPVSLFLFIRECIRFRKFTHICIDVINSNQEFYEYLEKLQFKPDWINRLYSVQEIPKEFKDFTDDELYDITMRALLPMTKLIERNVLVDVIGVIIRRISQELYTICLTPHNWNLVLRYGKFTIVSIIGWICFLVIYFYLHN